MSCGRCGTFRSRTTHARYPVNLPVIGFVEVIDVSVSLCDGCRYLARLENLNAIRRRGQGYFS